VESQFRGIKSDAHGEIISGSKPEDVMIVVYRAVLMTVSGQAKRVVDDKPDGRWEVVWQS
jgi:hypothetical protein